MPIALGTQTGGSVIRPASFNGTYGFKPTWGAISREGQKIHSLTFDTLGFFARSAADFKLLADVFEIHDDTPPEPEFGVAGASFAIAKTAVWPKAGPGTVAAMEKTAELLRESGARVEEVELPAEFAQASAWHKVLLDTDGKASFLPEYRRAADRLSPTIVGHVENIAGHTRAQILEAFDGLAALRPKLDAIAARYAAIITPSVPDEAPVGLHSTGDFCFNAMWTVCCFFFSRSTPATDWKMRGKSNVFPGTPRPSNQRPGSPWTE